MEGILESTTNRTLHAHNFSRTSSQASLLLTDLLSRYLSVLTSSCARYAHHAGRLNLTVKDALSALNEMGVNVDELAEYCKSEGKEFSRYAVQTARRLEDLREMKAGLMDGLKQDRDDAIHLTFTPVPEHMFLEEQEEDESGDSEETAKSIEKMAVDSPIMKEPARITYTPPPLPLSPISNPASPARKRARHASWEPPSHIPEFLPPFPVPKDNSAPNSPEQPPPFELPPQQHPILGKNDKPLSPLPQVSTSTSSSDYLTPVPYSQSSLATIPPWHLPSPPTETTLQPSLLRLQTPQTQPALLGAYHHILTHPQSRNANSANPSRHRVALSILYQTETNPRWEPADTLFSTSVPNAPRVSAMPPSHPVSKKAEEEGEKVDQEGNRVMLPSVPPIPVSNIDHITPLMSQQGSRIPEAARHVLSPSVYWRTTRLSHPPPLKRGNQVLTYGPGVSAPWNAINATTAAALPPVAKKEEKQVNGIHHGKGKEEPLPLLPDAKFYATWDYEQKNFKEPLVMGRKRTGSVQTSGPLGSRR